MRGALDDVEAGFGRGREDRGGQLADATTDRRDVDQLAVLEADRLTPGVAGAGGDLTQQIDQRKAVAWRDVRMRRVVEEVIDRVRRRDDVGDALTGRADEATCVAADDLPFRVIGLECWERRARPEARNP